MERRHQGRRHQTSVNQRAGGHAPRAEYVASLKSWLAAASFRSFPNPRWPSFFSMPFPSLFGLHKRHPPRSCLGRLRLWFMSQSVLVPNNVAIEPPSERSPLAKIGLEWLVRRHLSTLKVLGRDHDSCATRLALRPHHLEPDSKESGECDSDETDVRRLSLYLQRGHQLLAETEAVHTPLSPQA
jgi:hypothetical protein